MGTVILNTIDINEFFSVRLSGTYDYFVTLTNRSFLSDEAIADFFVKFEENSLDRENGFDCVLFRYRDNIFHGVIRGLPGDVLSDAGNGCLMFPAYDNMFGYSKFNKITNMQQCIDYILAQFS